MGEINKLGGKTSTGLDITTAFATFATKEELKESQQGILATHRITNVYGVIDSAINTTQDIQVVGTGFGIFSDNNIRVLLNNLITGESIEGKYTYTMSYVNTEHIILHLNIIDVVTDGSYVLYLGDVNGSIYLNPANTGSEALIRVGGYTQLDFNTWSTNPANALSLFPNNFSGGKNTMSVGTIGDGTNQNQYKEIIQSIEYIPENKNFDLLLNVADGGSLRIVELDPFIPAIIGITTNSNISIIPTDIICGILYNKTSLRNSNCIIYYCENGGQTNLLKLSTTYPRLSGKIRIKGSLSQLFITCTFDDVTYSKTIARQSGNLYLKAILYYYYYNPTILAPNYNSIGATINCKIW